MQTKPDHARSILLAAFITSLWSTSWVLIKIGLRGDLPPLTFAGLRYMTAFLSLAGFVLFNPKERAALKHITLADALWLSGYGLVIYTITQGGQFISLSYLPAAMVSLVLNTTAVAVGVSGIFFLKEYPSSRQWIGVVVTIIGVGIYFLPIDFAGSTAIGLLASFATMLGSTASALLGRKINFQSHLSPLTVTFVSMGVGSTALLAAGVSTQGLGHPSLGDWGIILFLAVVNTAFAFTVWNYTLRTLSAVEASVINSLMMPLVAILAYFILGETLSAKQIVGLLLVGAGVLVVQLRKR